MHAGNNATTCAPDASNDLGMPKIFEPILFRITAHRLDAELAAGQSAETSERHARRARMLVAPRSRRALAVNWEHALELAARPPGGLSGRVPVSRRRVLDAEPEIRRLIDALNASGPVPARGVAMARQLLTESGSPVYAVNRPALDLGELVGEAARRLDPAEPLMAASHMPVVKPTFQEG
jgi:hypothetical protein